MKQSDADTSSRIDSPGDLCDSAANYGGELGKWWWARAQNACHRYAYRTVADYLHASFRRSPELIIDYACGAGQLLARLCTRFARARLLGLDGSAFLLERARRRIDRLGGRAARRITLVETLLPNFTSGLPRADVVVYGFPNMVPPPGEDSAKLSKRYLGSADLAAADVLARASEHEYPSDDVQRVRNELLLGRLVSLNLRRLLKREGMCVRIEYAKVRRDQLSRTDFMRIAFEEGSLDAGVDGILPAHWFRVLASSFFRSHVTEDVYQQTGDESDRGGGYVITILRRCK